MERLVNIGRFAGPVHTQQGVHMLIRDVEKFMREHDMAATKFGRLAAHDPRFVLDLRMGRIPRPATEERTRAFMRDFVDTQTKREAQPC